MRTLIAVLVLALAGGSVAAMGFGGDPVRQRQLSPPVDPGLTAPEETPTPPIRWRRSLAVGGPAGGRLVNGVQLPPAGWHFATWDFVHHRSPNPGWRRWGTDRLVRLVLRVAREHRLAHPDAPRLLIGDLSRPHGGGFGVRYGRPGHLSHQNGLDVDVYYPRLDRREVAPVRVSEIDRELSQDLVDRFVRAGAVAAFVGPGTGLRGPKRIVKPLRKHDNHVHVRIR